MKWNFSCTKSGSTPLDSDATSDDGASRSRGGGRRGKSQTGSGARGAKVDDRSRGGERMIGDDGWGQDLAIVCRSIVLGVGAIGFDG